MKRMGLLLGTVCTSLLLSACGGGSACGGKTEWFSIQFAPGTQTLTKGVAKTVTSTVSPESCRGDMSFSVRTGPLPTGMKLENGNITGTPDAIGTYLIEVQIDSVANYSSFTSKPWGSVTLTVQ